MKTKRTNFLKRTVLSASVLMMLFAGSAFIKQSEPQVDGKGTAVQKSVSSLADGKAWWITYYITDKKLYITNAYNNDCFYCSAEINESFSKYLILNDYDNTPSKVNITSQYATSKADVDEIWEKIVLRYKGYGYSVTKVGFSYKEK